MKKCFIVILWFISMITCIFIGKHSYAKKVVTLQKRGDRFMSYYYLLTYWLKICQNGKSLKKYFEEKKYNNVIIYGYGPIGERLMDELRREDINVCLIVDSNLAEEDSRLGRIEDLEKQDADVVVVTPTFAYKEIKSSIEKKVTCPIVSLDDVVYSV